MLRFKTIFKKIKLATIIDWSTYLLLFLLPWQTRYIFIAGSLNKGPWIFGDISLFVSDILIIFLFIISLINKKLNKEKIFNSQYTSIYFLIAGLFFCSALSILIATNQNLAIFSLLKLSLGIMLFIIIVQNNFQTLKLWFWLLAGAVIQAGLAIWQFLNQGVVGNKWLGIAPHFAKYLGTSVVEAIGPLSHVWERWLRAYGGFGHPNILGGYLAINLIIIFFFLLQTKLKNKSWLYALAIILTTGLFFTFSRTAWIALVVASIIIISWQKIKPNLAPLLIIIFTAVLLLFPYHYLVTSRFGDLHRIEVKSIQERIDYTKNSLQLITMHPWLGVGLGNYGLAVFKQLDQRQLSYWYQPVHNVFLLIWTEIGLGALFFYALLIYLLYLSWEKRATKQAGFALPLLMAMIIIMFFDHWFWSLHFGQIFFWLLLALITKNIFQNKEEAIKL